MGLEGWFDRLGGVVHVDGNLWRSPIPMTLSHTAKLRKAGIRVVYSMEEVVPGALLQAEGFDWRPHFWTDDVPPTRPQIAAFLDDYLALSEDVPALVHCKAGWGRTGSAIACALMEKRGWGADAALRHYWSRVPAAEAVMVGNGQAEFVRAYGASRAGRGL